MPEEFYSVAISIALPFVIELFKKLGIVNPKIIAFISAIIAALIYQAATNVLSVDQIGVIGKQFAIFMGVSMGLFDVFGKPIKAYLAKK